MNNAEIYDLILFLINSSQQGGKLSPKEFNTLLWTETLQLFKVKIGLPEQFSQGKPIQKFEETQSNTDVLSKVKVWMGKNGTSPLVVDSNGYGWLPTDFYYPAALSYKLFKDKDCTGEFSLRKIDVLTDGQWDDIYSHPIRKPSKRYPICNFQNGYIRFAPENIQFVEFHYLRYPKTPVYDYYISADGDNIYLPTGTSHTLASGEEGSAGQQPGTTVVSQSVEIEFDDVTKIDIAYRICQSIGLNVREQFLYQVAEQRKITGQ